MLKLIQAKISGKKIQVLRALVMLGCKGRAHQYADHVYGHYNDCTYLSRDEFYTVNHLNTRKGR